MEQFAGTEEATAFPTFCGLCDLEVFQLLRAIFKKLLPSRSSRSCPPALERLFVALPLFLCTWIIPWDPLVHDNAFGLVWLLACLFHPMRLPLWRLRLVAALVWMPLPLCCAIPLWLWRRIAFALVVCISATSLRPLRWIAFAPSGVEPLRIHAAHYLPGAVEKQALCALWAAASVVTTWCLMFSSHFAAAFTGPGPPPQQAALRLRLVAALVWMPLPLRCAIPLWLWRRIAFALVVCISATSLRPLRWIAFAPSGVDPLRIHAAHYLPGAVEKQALCTLWAAASVVTIYIYIYIYIFLYLTYKKYCVYIHCRDTVYRTYVEYKYIILAFNLHLTI